MSNLNDFLITTGRTLAQMALYSTDHPAVQGAIQESHRLLGAILSSEPDLVISLAEGKVVVNGQIPDGVPETTLRPFLQMFNAFDLHSMSFLAGIEQQELIPFFRLASRNEMKAAQNDPAAYLESQNVSHIKFNLARYAKIGEGETIGAVGSIGGPVGGAAAANDADHSLREKLDDLPLNDLLKKLIEQAVPDPKDRAHIFERALGLVKEQITDAVNRVTQEFQREKTRLTGERDRTENVVENMAEGVVVVDESGKVLMMNPTAEAIYGVKLGECVGKPLWEGVRGEQMMALAKDLTVPQDRPIVKEVAIHGQPETQRVLRASTAAVQDVNGRVVGMVSVLSDVTKQRELMRLQNEFMANVTHDLRAPIHAVKLAVGAILEGSAGTVSTEQNKMLSMATRNIERLSRLIDDLLDFSKIESGKMQIHAQVMELSPLLTEAVQSMDAWAKSRTLTLRYAPAPDLPLVYADGDRILQVVNNLISNAIKFTPVGGRIEVAARPVDDGGKKMVAISVEDTGPGVSKDDQARIFNRFVQLKSSSKQEVKGTGLGLSICNAFVDLHKGRLWLESPAPGQKQGSLFAFTLPAVQRSAATVRATAPAEEKKAAPKKSSFWKRIFSRSHVFLFALFLSSIAHARPYWGTVRRVIEPGVYQLQNGTIVKTLGIDAPEKGSAAYEDAFAAHRQAVEKKEIRLKYGTQERDTSGAWLAYIYVDGIFLNEQLVRDGLALVAPLPNKEDVLSDLLRAELLARREQRGVWRDPNVPSYGDRAKKKSGLPF